MGAYESYLNHQGHTATNLEWWFPRLKEMGILTSSGNRYQVAMDMMEDVSAWSFRQGRGADICAYLRGRWKTREKSHLGRARWALHAGDYFRFERELQEGRRHARFGNRDEQDILDSIAEGVGTELPLDSWPQDVSLIIAHQGVVHSINQAKPGQVFARWLAKNAKDSDECLRHVRFLSGEEVPESSYLQELRQLLSGDITAHSRLNRKVSASGRKRFFPFSSQEFIYLVARFSTDVEPAIENRGLDHSVIQPYLDWLLSVRKGVSTTIPSEIEHQLNDSDTPPMIRFFLYLVCYWAGFSKLLNPEEVALLGARYREAGYIVLARELEALAAHCKGEPESLTPFLRLLTPQEPWRTKLKNLDSWSKNAPPLGQRKPHESEERLVWQFDPVTYLLTPKVQKIGKSGHWTKGRAVSIGQLRYEATGAVTDLDEAVISAWSQSQRHYYDYGPRGGVRVDDVRILESLVGHPHLTDHDGERLRLRSIQPILRVEELEDRLNLRLCPEVPRRQDFALRKLGPNNYGLVRFLEGHLELDQILTATGLHIPNSELETVQAILARAAALGLEIESFLQVSEVLTEPLKPHLVLRLLPRGRGLSLLVTVQPGEGGLTYDAGEGPRFLLRKDSDSAVQYQRDMEGERELLATLQESIPGLHRGQAEFPHPGECLALLEVLRGLPQDSYSLQWPEGQTVKSEGELEWSDLRLSVRDGKDWFTVETELQLDGFEHLQLFQLLELHRTQGTRFVELDENRYLTLSETFLRRVRQLESLALKEKNGAYELHPLAASLFLESENVESTDAAWEKSKKRLQAAKELDPKLPSGLQATLRPYQIRGFEWLARSAEWGVGVCLADDMGLGKTVQILSVLLRRASLGPTLVVAPTSVCANWCEEARRFAPELNPIVFQDSEREAVVESAGPSDLVICSYGVLVTSLKLLKKITWTNLVLDESQAIKNSKTQRAKAAYALEADFRIAATGTPVENHLGELWSLFRFLNPGMLGSQRSFTGRFGTGPGQREALRDLIAPFLLRRLKENVLTELPAKTEITVKVELTREERLFYESVRLNAVEKIEHSPESALISILAELTRLRRACCHPTLLDPQSKLGSSKLERFVELVGDLREAGHRVLVFSQFVDHLSVLKAEIERLKIPYQYLDGSTPRKARQKAVEQFQSGEGDLFLISLKAGGTGLNLTQANYVIHMDPWWNPAAEDQASDRAHRMGQQKPVTVYRLIAADTVEEKILRLHEEKRELVDSLLAGADRAAKLSAEELLELLKESTQSAI